MESKRLLPWIGSSFTLFKQMKVICITDHADYKTQGGFFISECDADDISDDQRDDCNHIQALKREFDLDESDPFFVKFFFDLEKNTNTIVERKVTVKTRGECWVVLGGAGWWPHWWLIERIT